jgi:Ca-dependent carbohydrate-binding module xylan-binding
MGSTTSAMCSRLLRVGGREIKVLEVPNSKGAVFEVRATLAAGSQKVAIAYLNNYNKSEDPDPQMRGDRNLFVEYVEVESPAGAPPALPESHKRLIARKGRLSRRAPTLHSGDALFPAFPLPLGARSGGHRPRHQSRTQRF